MLLKAQLEFFRHVGTHSIFLKLATVGKKKSFQVFKKINLSLAKGNESTELCVHFLVGQPCLMSRVHQEKVPCSLLLLLLENSTLSTAKCRS